MFIQDGYAGSGDNDHHPSFCSSSHRDVCYSCGSCGYALNLCSSNRNTSTIGSKYGKSIKRGIISFFSIDESRFTEIDEISCIPFVTSKYSWGLFRRRKSLLCGKCGNHIGHAYEERIPSSLSADGSELSSGGSELSSGKGNTVYKKFDIKIRSLQPSASEESGVPLVI